MRFAVGALLLGGSVGVVTPLGLGLWNPSWLRLAGDVELDPTEPKLEPGEVRHPFVVEQSDLNGRLRWRLSGAGLRGPSDAADLLKDQLVLEPRLELFSAGGQEEVTRLRAERARVRVSEGEGGARRVRLDLGPGLRLERGGLSLRGQSLVAWFDPDHPNDLRLRTPEPLRLEFAEEGARWRLDATSLQASAEQIVLGGPVQVEGGPFRGGPLSGYSVQGVAQSAVLEPRGERSSEAGLSGPWALSLRGLELEGTGAGPGERFELRADRAGVRLRAAAARGAQPKPEALSLEGSVRARFRRGAPPARDLSLSGERLTLAERSGVVLEGRGAELSESRAGFRARGQRFELRELAGGVAELLAKDLSEFELREVASPERAPATWRGRAGSLRVEVAGVAGLTSASIAELWSGARPQPEGSQAAGGAEGQPAQVAPLTTAARVTSLLERVRALEVAGGLEVARSPGPDRVRCESLRWSQGLGEGAPKRLEAEGLAALLSQPSPRRAQKGEGQAPAPGVPWAVEAGSLRLTTRESLASLAALASGSEVSPGTLPWSRPLAALESLRASGGFRLERRGQEPDPRRRLRKARGLSADALSYSDDQLVATGRAEASMGALTVSAPELKLGPESGRVEARDVVLGLVRLRRTKVEGRETLVREDYRARAAEGVAVLSLDPADSARERERRRGRRRSGAALTVPEPLRSLDLRGGVVASGPRGLKAEATRVRLEGRRLRLEGSPARLSEERGRIAAKLLRLSWAEADLAPLNSGSPASARDATRALVEAEGGVSATGALGARSFTLDAERARGEVYEVVGLPAKDPRAPFPLGAFSASGPESVTLTWVAKDRQGGSRDLKLRSARLRGNGRAESPGGGQALRLELQGRWATTLELPKRGMSQVSGGRASAFLDPSALREGARPEEKEEAYLRRVLRGLEISEGLRLSASGFEARAKEARLDAERSAYVLSGDPVVFRRGGLRQTMRQATIRLSEE